MKRAILLTFMILSLAEISIARNYAYIVDGLSETLSRIDLASGSVENDILTLGVVPNQVVCHDDRLYVVNSISASLQVIAIENNQVVHDIPLPINSNPWNVAVDGDFALVTGFASAMVYKVNLNTATLADAFATGQSPEGVIVLDDRLYIANTAFNPVDFSYGQGSITILNAADGSFIDQVHVGKNPQAMAVGPDGMINISCTGDYAEITGTIYFLDPSDNTVFDSLAIGGNPFMPAVNPTGRGFVTAGGWVDHGYLYSYDAVNRTILRGSDNPILVGIGAMGIAVDSLGYIYTTNQLGNSVNKLNSAGDILATYTVPGGPMSIAIFDTRTAVDENPAIPQAAELPYAYPNPFNGSVTIQWPAAVGQPEQVFLEIFDAQGRLVRTLGPQIGLSTCRIHWNGEDGAGEQVSTGVYFARPVGSKQAVRMVLLK